MTSKYPRDFYQKKINKIGFIYQTPAGYHSDHHFAMLSPSVVSVQCLLQGVKELLSPRDSVPRDQGGITSSKLTSMNLQKLRRVD